MPGIPWQDYQPVELRRSGWLARRDAGDADHSGAGRRRSGDGDRAVDCVRCRQRTELKQRLTDPAPIAGRGPSRSCRAARAGYDMTETSAVLHLRDHGRLSARWASCVIAQHRPHGRLPAVHAAWASAGLYFLLSAEFLAAVQLVVYAGGTLILIIFGVMLTSKSRSAASSRSWPKWSSRFRSARFCCVALIAGIMRHALRRAADGDGHLPDR